MLNKHWIKKSIIIALPLLGWVIGIGQVTQIDIPRIATMPDLPSPYNMRDWKKVAMQFDSFVYNPGLSGQYLPLVSYQANGVNYPNQKQIKLHTYVGTNSPLNGEGINILPSLVGASLVGNDIRSMYGVDRLVMSQDFYNKKNGQNIYLNGSSTSSGGDWWYDVMPNIYFYQLHDLFGEYTSETKAQFISVADQFLSSVHTMGGNVSPWTIPNMNYRAWDFKNMTPNASGVIEPEAGGGYAWILYNAYLETGNREYLRGAEWALEFLNNLSSNPSYELQLPYGAYIAAKMNAQLGTTYDIEKIVNWTFNRGPLRGWGAISGRWGGFDVHGLIGEANDNGNDYAFLMNGMQQAAALVPMVKYDKRFAKSIAKWMLNVGNASRLMYPGFLLSSQQDDALWSGQNDPAAVIAHESMKEVKNNIRPFATGDAKGGGWASTNLAIYGSSSVGYFGAIIERTNVNRILQLDLNATDFFTEDSYPTYLYFNPNTSKSEVNLTLPIGEWDVYNTITESFIAKGVSNSAVFSLESKEVAILVIVPKDGTMTFDKNKMLINGVVVDYNQTENPFNYGPRIKGFGASSNIIEKGKSLPIHCTAEDKDSPELQYEYRVTSGTIDGMGDMVTWNIGDKLGQDSIWVIVTDETGLTDSSVYYIEVVDYINTAPVIDQLIAIKEVVETSETITLQCIAVDNPSDLLTYTWSTDRGQIIGSGSTVQFIAPSNQAEAEIKVTVTDQGNLSAMSSKRILVKDFVSDNTIIAEYLMMGNANDSSGNELHGTPKGVVITTDFNNQPNGAYYFNGATQHIAVPNHSKLDEKNQLSVEVYCKSVNTADKETFIVSHGSWQNRWKVSLTPDKKIRWTVNTTARTVDTDSKTLIQYDSIYHIVVTFDGTHQIVYVNGRLESFTSHQGSIKSTTLPLLIGQMIPEDASYNFKGTIDFVKIYKGALTPTEVAAKYNAAVLSSTSNDVTINNNAHIYPNPATNSIVISSDESSLQNGIVEISNIGGQIVKKSKLIGGAREVEIQDLPKGAYILRLFSHGEDLSIEKQFIKQ